jgi:hypothetical protein
MNLVGKGFRLSPQEVVSLGYDLASLPPEIKPHCNARDLMQGGEACYVIDLFGYTAEEARQQHPALYQWLLDRVKPERDQNNRESRRRNWWLFGETVGKLRKAWQGLNRVIITAETAKHKVFTFVTLPFCPDHKLYAVCSDDAHVLGVLSSRIHVIWALATGGTLEDRPTWTNTTCFATFPFPATSDDQKQKIRAIAEELDAHRKRQQARHPELTLTGMYNVLERLRSGEPLTAKEKTIHEQGLVSVLKELHDNLDAAVAEAYGWPVDLPDEELLERLVALNAERTREEAQGVVRWLRPEYQKPETSEQQTTIPSPLAGEGQGGGEAASVNTSANSNITHPLTPSRQGRGDKIPWPKTLPEQVQAVRTALAAAASPVTAEALARTFLRARSDKVAELLVTLTTLGQVRETEDGKWAG